MKLAVKMLNMFAGGSTLPSWLTTGGLALSDWIVAHDALAAANLAASYSNLVNPGTNDLTAPAAAPGWDAVNGWTFNGTTQYLQTVAMLASYSVVVQYTDYSANHLLGSFQASDKATSIEVAAGEMKFYKGTGSAENAPVFAAGVYILSDRTAYRDGVADANSSGSGGTDPDIAGFIGCVNYPAGGGAFDFAAVKVQRFALANRALLQAEITAIVAAMA